MVYLNNAATSYPKPPCVVSAVSDCLAGIPAGQFRSSTQGEGGDILDTCREGLAPLLGVSQPSKIYFTSGATEAANAVINGIPWNTGRVVVSAAEHNSILRPLNNLRQPPEIRVAPCDSRGYVSAESIRQAAIDGCDAVFINHCSNVTGAVQDLPPLAEAAREAGAIFILDASQSAGCIPLETEKNQIDFLIFTGHKSLLGPQGTGGFYAKLPEALRPFKFGGTGLESAKLLYNLNGDQEFEPGTQNLAGFAGLCAAVSYIQKTGLETIYRQENKLTTKLVQELEAIPGVTVYCGDTGKRGPVVSFTMAGLAPADVAYMLQGGYGITVRAGLHCSPLIHRYIGCGEKGTVRAGLSCFNSHHDIKALVQAIQEIAAALPARGSRL